MDNEAHSALVYSEQEKHRNELRKKDELEKQKIDEHNQNSIKIAEETKNIGKETLVVSKRTFYVAIIGAIASVISIIISLFK